MESWDSYRKHLNTDLQRLESLLATAMDSAGWRPPASGRLRVLDPACGRCDEAATLVNWFARRLAATHPAPEVSLLGADIRPREIARAREAFPGSSFEFIVADCSKLRDHREIGGDFGVIFVRHQNLWFDRKVWTVLYAGLLELLADDGVLVITSYFDREHLQALALLRQLGGRLAVTLQNPLSRPLNHPGKSVDRHLAVLRRAGTSGGGLIV